MRPLAVHSPTPSTPPRSVARALTTLLASLAIALQCLVIQGHVDFASWTDGAASARTEAASVDQPHQHGAALVGCSICQAAATNGGIVLGGGPWQPLVWLVQFKVRAAESRADVTVRPSHAWRSRAPPSFL